MVWVNLIAIIILAIVLFKQYSDTKKSVKKTKELIFNLKDSLQKEISKVENKVEKLETRVSVLNPEGIIERINNIKKELEESFSNRFEQIKGEMEKLQRLFENYISGIERKIGLIDMIVQKFSQISSSSGEKIRGLRAKKTQKKENH